MKCQEGEKNVQTVKKKHFTDWNILLGKLIGEGTPDIRQKPTIFNVVLQKEDTRN